MKTKECTYLAVILSIILALVNVVFLGNANAASSINQNEELIRFHIRANSNSNEDIAKKMKAKDAINEYIQDALLQTTSISQAREYINSNMDELLKIAQDASGQTATGSLKYEYFPTRIYNGVVYPEGEYEALVILLGEGEGENWWCVAFPPLCYSTYSNSSEPKVVYKSFFADLFKRIFG